MHDRMNLEQLLEYTQMLDTNPDARAPVYKEYLDYAKSYGQTPSLTHNGPNGTVGMRSELPTPTATSSAVPAASHAPQSPAYPGGDAPGIASYYRNSALQGYQGGQQQPQSAMAGDVREATRNAQYMAAEPQATSSIGSAQIMARQPADLQNAVTARVANSYNGMVGAMSDPNRMTPDQKLGLARESALRTAGGGAAADPTGMASRFGGALGQQATSDYDAIQNGQAVRLADGTVSRFTGTPASASATMARGRAEREAERAANPVEDAKRRQAIAAATRDRASRASAFRDSHAGLNPKQFDRLERQRRLTEKSVSEGRITREEANARMEFAMDRAKSRAQKSTNSDQARPLSEMPNRPNLQTQQPEVAKAAVETMTTQSPIIKDLGWTPQSKPQDVMDSIAGMNPQQMTSTQKFEAARHIHEYMLSQVESGNPDYAIEDGIASDGSDPRVGFIGLSGLKPGDKDAMVRWFDDLHRQAQALGTPATASPFGNALPRRTGA
jgi:polyhydroxyalkanoate synthesis regulator phasin